MLRCDQAPNSPPSGSLAEGRCSRTVPLPPSPPASELLVDALLVLLRLQLELRGRDTAVLVAVLVPEHVPDGLLGVLPGQQAALALLHLSLDEDGELRRGKVWVRARGATLGRRVSGRPAKKGVLSQTDRERPPGRGSKDERRGHGRGTGRAWPSEAHREGMDWTGGVACGRGWRAVFQGFEGVALSEGTVLAWAVAIGREQGCTQEAPAGWWLNGCVGG